MYKRQIITPNLLLERSNNFAKTIDIPKKHLDLVREGMYLVVNKPGGTAYGSKIWSKKYSMVGKTGTAQVISKKNFENLNEEEQKKIDNHALFVGYGPYKDPKYSVAVVIEHGGGGSKAAAPVARDILKYAFDLDAKRKALDEENIL